MLVLFFKSTKNVAQTIFSADKLSVRRFVYDPLCNDVEPDQSILRVPDVPTVGTLTRMSGDVCDEQLTFCAQHPILYQRSRQMLNLTCCCRLTSPQ